MADEDHLAVRDEDRQLVHSVERDRDRECHPVHLDISNDAGLVLRTFALGEHRGMAGTGIRNHRSGLRNL